MLLMIMVMMMMIMAEVEWKPLNNKLGPVHRRIVCNSTCGYTYLF